MTVGHHPYRRLRKSVNFEEDFPLDITTAIVIELATFMLNFVELNFDDDNF